MVKVFIATQTRSSNHCMLVLLFSWNIFQQFDENQGRVHQFLRIFPVVVFGFALHLDFPRGGIKNTKKMTNICFDLSTQCWEKYYSFFTNNNSLGKCIRSVQQFISCLLWNAVIHNNLLSDFFTNFAKGPSIRNIKCSRNISYLSFRA